MLDHGHIWCINASRTEGCAQTSFDPKLEAAAVQVLIGISAARNKSSAAIGETSKDPRVKKENVNWAWLIAYVHKIVIGAEDNESY